MIYEIIIAGTAAAVLFGIVWISDDAERWNDEDEKD